MQIRAWLLTQGVGLGIAEVASALSPRLIIHYILLTAGGMGRAYADKGVVTHRGGGARDC